MNSVLTIGPLVIPAMLLLVGASIAITLMVAERIGRTRGINVEPVLWRAFLIGIVLARLGFVYQFRSAYLDTPLGMLDIRDGGWSPEAGFVAAWLYLVSHAARHPPTRKPLQAAAAIGSVVWLAGAVGLALLPGPGQALPSLTLSTMDGRTVDLASFRGKPTVVNLWATWCPPCIREMPVLQKAQVAHPSIDFVFVNQGETSRQVETWLAERQVALRNVVLDESRKVGAAFGQSAYPTTLFFDEHGTLVATRIGELSSATLAEKLARVSR